MLGQVSQFTQAGGLYLNFTGIKWSAFVQDNWRAESRLTLNLGLRWDPWFPYKDSQGRVGCFEPGKQSQRFPNAPLGLLFGGSNHDPGCPSASIEASLRTSRRAWVSLTGSPMTAKPASAAAPACIMRFPIQSRSRMS